MTAETESSSSNTATKLPPGMVLGPDGKPCKICTSSAEWRNWKRNTTKKATHAEQSSSSSTSAATSGGASASAVAAAAALGTAVQSTTPQVECPPDVEQLGRATWTFLHTTAAYYPEKPTPTQRANMLSLLRSLPVLYPCSWCASHLKDNMASRPPDVSGRLGLSRWLCEQHNDVNERLGKERFDCSKTDERWKDGPSDGSCD
ncbi:hypothetical protein HGRIS_004198 [Hohenbuehelia grisea]|uniref:Sulfhydryl oxidase n=1 Tax=Hohenbuehelia grisea TaxID=104357 RepID=A0ABR3JIG2_9AGAR